MGNIGTGSGTSYPVSLDAQSAQEVDSPSASKTRLRAAVPNDLIACTLAVEAATGVAPQGTKADVKTFLQVQHAAAGTHTGYVTVQSNASSTRTVLTVYQNTSGKPMYLSIWKSVTAGNIDQMYIYSDASPDPGTTVCSFIGSSSAMCVFAIIPNGHYYKMGENHTGVGTGFGWFEWT